MVTKLTKHPLERLCTNQGKYSTYLFWFFVFTILHDIIDVAKHRLYRVRTRQVQRQEFDKWVFFDLHHGRTRSEKQMGE